MARLAIIVAFALAAFIAYFLIVIRFRSRQERQRERKLGLDPLRRG